MKKLPEPILIEVLISIGLLYVIGGLFVACLVPAVIGAVWDKIFDTYKE